MIAALILIAVVGWSCWLMQRAGRCPQRTIPLATPAPQVSCTTTALGLEDDPDQWRVWTALDERQLVRLLTDSAPVNRPATKAKDNHVRPIEREDTA